MGRCMEDADADARLHTRIRTHTHTHGMSRVFPLYWKWLCILIHTQAVSHCRCSGWAVSAINWAVIQLWPMSYRSNGSKRFKCKRKSIGLPYIRSLWNRKQPAEVLVFLKKCFIIVIHTYTCMCIIIIILAFSARRSPIYHLFPTRWVSQLLGLVLVSWTFVRIGVHRPSIRLPYLMFSIRSFCHWISIVFVLYVRRIATHSIDPSLTHFLGEFSGLGLTLIPIIGVPEADQRYTWSRKLDPNFCPGRDRTSNLYI